MKDARAIQQLFERYQRERTAFAGSIIELTRHDSNTALIEKAGGVPFLVALLADPIPGIRRYSALGLGRIAAQSLSAANKIVADRAGAVIPLLALLSTPVTHPETTRRREGLELRRAAALTLRNCCKHGISLCRVVIEEGGVGAAVGCLGVADAETREGAAWLLDTIAAQSEEFSNIIIECNEVFPALISCFEFSEVAVKRAAASVLGTLAAHGPRYAQSVWSHGAFPPLVSCLAAGPTTEPNQTAHDVRLARHVLCALSQIVQGGKEVATSLVSLQCAALTSISRCLHASNDDLVQRFAASVLRDVACHDAALAEEVAALPQALPLLIQLSQQVNKGLHTLPAIMAVGHIGAATPVLAEQVINADGLRCLATCIAHHPDEPAKCAAAWAVGQIGKHSSMHSQAVAESGALLALTGLEAAPTSTPELRAKCSKAAYLVIGNLNSMPALDALLRIPGLSPAVKTAVLDRLSTVLGQDPNGTIKASFVQSNGLELVQQLGEEPCSMYATSVGAITALFPRELVNRYSPAYNRMMLERLVRGSGSDSGGNKSGNINGGMVEISEEENRKEAVVKGEGDKRGDAVDINVDTTTTAWTTTIVETAEVEVEAAQVVVEEKKKNEEEVVPVGQASLASAPTTAPTTSATMNSLDQEQPSSTVFDTAMSFTLLPPHLAARRRTSQQQLNEVATPLPPSEEGKQQEQSSIPSPPTDTSPVQNEQHLV